MHFFIRARPATASTARAIEQYNVGRVCCSCTSCVIMIKPRFLIHLNNRIMEMDCPPACYFVSVQDGKQEIYLEWPNVLNATGQQQKLFNQLKKV